MGEIRERVWPLGGYAPGNYLCTCLDCGATFEGDKRAYQCLPCAAWAEHDRTEARQAPEKAFEESGDHGAFTPVTITSSTPAPQPAGTVTEEMVDRALAFWCSKLPKAQREQPIPDKLRQHMRSTLEAAFAARPAAEPVAVKGLTEYELQVLLGTSIHGRNMPPDRVFSLDMAWHRLFAEGLIDRTDGLAIITSKGEALVRAALSAPAPGLVEALREGLRFVSNIDNSSPAAHKLRAALASITETGGAK